MAAVGVSLGIERKGRGKIFGSVFRGKTKKSFRGCEKKVDGRETMADSDGVIKLTTMKNSESRRCIANLVRSARSSGLKVISRETCNRLATGPTGAMGFRYLCSGFYVSSR